MVMMTWLSRTLLHWTEVQEVAVVWEERRVGREMTVAIMVRCMRGVQIEILG
jgi:hypothetical protein